MSIYEYIYTALLEWRKGSREKEPDHLDALPQDIRRAIKKTIFMDTKRAQDTAMAMAMVERAKLSKLSGPAPHMQDLRTAHARMAGLSGSASAEFARLQNRGLGNQYQQEPNNSIVRQVQKDTAKFNPTPQRNQNMDSNDIGEYTTDGIMRIKFPFGEVEMNVNNEAELDRAYEMAKHMLKVHEENTATEAIKKQYHPKLGVLDNTTTTVAPWPLTNC